MSAIFRPTANIVMQVVLLGLGTLMASGVLWPTMCAFGGEALDVLYVTSAADKLSRNNDCVSR